MTKHKIENIRMGEILMRDYLIPRNISIKQLANGTGISEDEIHEIIQGEKGIDNAIATALGQFFGNNAEFWIIDSVPRN